MSGHAKLKKRGLTSDEAKHMLDATYGTLETEKPKREVKTVSNTVLFAIISTELCERLAFYGLTGSLVLFLKRELNESTAEASSNMNIFKGVSYLCTLAGGFVADTYLGKYKTILYFVIIYQIGLFIVSFSAWSIKEDWVGLHSADAGLFWLGLYLVALGTGGIKPCVSTLGAEQFEIEDMQLDDDVFEKQSRLLSLGVPAAAASAKMPKSAEATAAKMHVEEMDHTDLDGGGGDGDGDDDMADISEKRSLHSVDLDETGSKALSSIAFEDPLLAEIRQKKESFFRWFYFSINLGSFIAYTTVAYLCQDVSFAVGYLVPTVGLLLAIVFYVSASGEYKRNPPTHKFELGTCLGIIFQGLGRLFLDRCFYKGRLRRQGASGRALLDAHGNEQTAAGYQSADGGSEEEDDEWHWILYASAAYGGSYNDSQIRKCSYVVNVMPFLWVYGVFWAVYAQKDSLFYAQGCQMDLRLVSGFSIPIACLNLFNILPILLFVPLMDRYILPFLRVRLGLRVTMLQRIGAGFVVSALTMVTAAVVEVSRKHTHDIRHGSHTESTCDDSLQVSDLSITWQIPQFALVGISEVLASITGLEFFFSQSPPSMRTTMMALFQVTNAFGSLFVPILILLVNVDSGNKWITNDLDNGHLDWYFVLLVILTLAATGVFIYVANNYEYQYPEEDEVETLGAFSKKRSVRGRRPADDALAIDDEPLESVYQTPPKETRRAARLSSVSAL